MVFFRLLKLTNPLSSILVSLLMGSFAVANDVGNDTQNFNPTLDGMDFVTVQSSETLKMGQITFGIFGNSAHNVLPTTVDANGKTTSSHDTLNSADINVGYGLTKNVDIGANISYLVEQKTDRSEAGAQFSKSGLNEIRAGAKYNMIRRDPYGLATIVSANFNQVKNNPFLGSGAGPTLNLELAGDTEFGDGYVAAINVGYRFRNNGTPIPGAVYSPLANEFIESVGLSRFIPQINTKVIGEIFARKPSSASTAMPNDNWASEILLGAKYSFNSSAAIQAGISTQLTEGLFTPDIRFYVGFNAIIGLIKEPIEGPAAPPAPAAVQIIKRTTKVGFQPEEIEEFKKHRFDALTAEHEFFLRRAVPSSESSVGKPPFEVLRLENFDFDYASATIRSRNNSMLNEVIRYLNSPPEVLKIRIEGHTDSQGSDENNVPLSGRRAESVKEYLQSHGLNPTINVEAVGYGSGKPIADNSKADGRQQNRRVEIRILRKILAKENEL